MVLEKILKVSGLVATATVAVAATVAVVHSCRWPAAGAKPRQAG